MNIDALVDTAWKGLRGEFDQLMGLGDVPSLTGFDKVLQEIAPSMADASVGGNVYNWATDPDNVALLGKNTFFGKLASVGKEFVGNVGEFAKTSGLDQISGYVDIDLTDLAKSAIGLGASFDSCDFGVSGIQNYYTDPAGTGVKLLANYAPKIGDTDLASGVEQIGMTAQAYLNFRNGQASSILNINLGSLTSTVGDYALDRLGSSIDSRDIKTISDAIKSQTVPSRKYNFNKRDDGTTELTDASVEVERLYQDVYDTILGE